MDTQQFSGETMVFVISGMGDVIGDVCQNEGRDVIEFHHPCLIMIQPDGQLQMRDLIRGNTLISGEFYYVNPSAVGMAYRPSPQLLSAYQIIRAGLYTASPDNVIRMRQ